MFLPSTPEEMKALGWRRLDAVIVTGDAYLDSPFIGAAVVGRVLREAGFRVGIVAQPRLDTDADIARLGEPALFWGVTGGSVDSMVANYTATGKRRKSDDFTPGGRNDRRPDRAVIAYTNLIRRHFKPTAPIVLGGIEASLRRIAHYDYWDDRVRRSVLVDAKADYLVYGMAEQTVVRLARALRDGGDPRDLPGLCYRARTAPEGFVGLPSADRSASDGAAFADMFDAFTANGDPVDAVGLFQPHGSQVLVHNPPAPPLAGEALDAVYEMDFTGDAHPVHRPHGPVRALDTIRFSITAHRGCYGGCSFCAIAAHQGRTVHWRSRESVLREVARLTRHRDFKGIVSDVGGPTANMYGIECPRKAERGACRDRQCLFPTVCRKLEVNHRPQMDLLRAVRGVPGVKSVFVASGLRHDLVLADRRWGLPYLTELARHHVSGQLKVAPEHSDPAVLRLMGKPGIGQLDRFRDLFDRAARSSGKRLYLTYYLMAAHPGCGMAQMGGLRTYLGTVLRHFPEQVQVFTPTPSTRSALMYHLGIDPATGSPIPVEKTVRGKERQKALVAARRAAPTAARTRRSGRRR